MYPIQKIGWFYFILSIGISQNILPLTQRYFDTGIMDYDYRRGSYIIVLADADLEDELTAGNDDFVHFKKTQGYDVQVISFNDSLIGGNKDSLKTYLMDYYTENDSTLEYVLLVGDVSGSYIIPTFEITSYKDCDNGLCAEDATDFPYTFNNDPLNPLFFIGRWSIHSTDDLKNLTFRSIQYIRMEYNNNYSFLNHALVVAGNYSNKPPMPITPVWTSNWLKDELIYYGMEQVDTAYYYDVDNQQAPGKISDIWNNGVGVINYRGWGDATGWHYPDFDVSAIDGLTINTDMGPRWPVVMSFVCNTGDFGYPRCFGEALITGGTSTYPTGAVAMIGPSDLDTDTKFNNVMCAVMWDELLEGRVPELGPALHAGKQSLIKEFGDLEAEDGTNIVEFYHHIYGVLGDPSLPVWLGAPNEISADIEGSTQLINKYISTTVTGVDDVPLMDVVGALMHGEELIAKGLSNQDGKLDLSFDISPGAGATLDLYLNKPQYFQKKIGLTFPFDSENTLIPSDYSIPVTEVDNSYIAIDSDSDLPNAPNYEWVEINTIGTNLNLTDDSIVEVDLEFSFQYYGEIFNSLTVCSNGWVSFLPCLSKDQDRYDCTSLPYFANNSIGHPLGPYGMIAPFFDDLDDDWGTVPFNVYFYTNGEDSVIIEWDHVVNGETDGKEGPQCTDDPGNCDWETFQLILVGESSSGNGEIIFQYQEIHDVDDHGSTVGIESPDKNTGVQYLFNFEYASNDNTLHDNLAIRFTSSMDLDIKKKLLPEGYKLNTYPNPFNPVITISLSIPEMEFANVDIFDIQGRKVTNLVNGNYQPGNYSVTWDASAYSSGVYLITFSASGIRLTQKVLLLK